MKIPLLCAKPVKNRLAQGGGGLFGSSLRIFLKWSFLAVCFSQKETLISCLQKEKHAWNLWHRSAVGIRLSPSFFLLVVNDKNQLQSIVISRSPIDAGYVKTEVWRIHTPRDSPTPALKHFSFKIIPVF